MEQRHDSAPAGQKFSFLSPPLLAFSTPLAFPCLSSPRVSLGPQHLSPRTIAAALARLLLMLLIRALQPTPITPVLLSWPDLAFTFQEEGHSSVFCVMDRVEMIEGRGEGSVWLVIFNAGEDVSVRSCDISELEMCHAIIIRGNIVVFTVCVLSFMHKVGLHN